jgi:hypothetical protein
MMVHQPTKTIPLTPRMCICRIEKRRCRSRTTFLLSLFSVPIRDWTPISGKSSGTTPTSTLVKSWEKSNKHTGSEVGIRYISLPTAANHSRTGGFPSIHELWTFLQQVPGKGSPRRWYVCLLSLPHSANYPQFKRCENSNLIPAGVGNRGKKLSCQQT